MLNISNTSQGSLIVYLFLAFLTLSAVAVEVSVVLSQEDTMIAHVLESFIHPASLTSIVLFVTVYKLLDGVLLKMIAMSRNESQRF